MSGMSNFCTSVPSEFARYKTGSPARSLTNTICLPVFGLNAGEVLTPAANVTFFIDPPVESLMKISGSPPWLDINAIWLPSGDQAGELFDPRYRGNEINRSDAAE